MGFPTPLNRNPEKVKKNAEKAANKVAREAKKLVEATVLALNPKSCP